MAWILIALTIVLLTAAVHGLATGAILARHVGDVKRAQSPKVFWLLVVAYVLFAMVLGRMAYFDFASSP